MNLGEIYLEENLGIEVLSYYTSRGDGRSYIAGPVCVRVGMGGKERSVRCLSLDHAKAYQNARGGESKEVGLRVMPTNMEAKPL